MGFYFDQGHFAGFVGSPLFVETTDEKLAVRVKPLHDVFIPASGNANGLKLSVLSVSFATYFIDSKAKMH